MRNSLSFLFIAIILSSCGFQQRQYTHGYWGSNLNNTTSSTSLRKDISKRDLVDEIVHIDESPQPLAVKMDTLIIPTSSDTLVDSIPPDEELNQFWEGDQTIAKDSLNSSIPYIEEKITRRANTSYITGWVALIFPVLGVVIPYLLNAAFPNQAGWGLLGFMLYSLMQFTAIVAMFVAAATGFKATQYLESLGIQNQFPEVYEKARKGKKYALIALSVRLGIFVLSSIGFLVLISYLAN